MLKREIEEQIRAVREGVGLIDRAEIGLLAARGADRFSWLQGMVSNDTRLLEQGAPRLQACILNATGHLLSDVVLINVTGDDPYVLMELPRANVPKILPLLDRFIIMEDVELGDVSEAVSCLSLQGPRAATLLPEKREGVTWPARVEIARVEADHTGSGGLDVYVPAAQARVFAGALREAGAVGVGAEAQEILRVEAGIPKYGVDMDESVIALEANLGPTHISLTKGCYVGQEIIARIDSRGHTNRALTGLILEGELLASGAKLFPLPIEGEPTPREVGWITSVVPAAPAAGGRPIALGYVRHEHRAPGTHLAVGEVGGATTATVAELPFYRRESA